VEEAPVDMIPARRVHEFAQQINNWLAGLQYLADATRNHDLGTNLFALRCWIASAADNEYRMPPPPRALRDL
jgi:hypothetical protein